MNLQTKVSITEPPFKLDHSDKIISLGSCFSDNLANKLSDFKFNIFANPFGVLYNPFSISNALKKIISGTPYNNDVICKNNNQYYSFNHHSTFNNSNKELLLENINNCLAHAHDHYNQTTCLFITFGTAFVYRLKYNNSVVSNCHKLPSDLFIRDLLSPDEIVNEYQQLIDDILLKNPNMKFIFTISPVRHLRNSAYENSVSKSHLFCALHKILNSNKSTYYFPSYEIMIDELRDYRFYADDMTHPSTIAQTYIFNKFKSYVISDNITDFFKNYEAIIKARQHKLMTNNPKSIEKFNASIIKKINMISNKYPFLDFSSDLTFFS